MASSGKKKTTMAKLNRESKLRERRQDKAARKDARKRAAIENPDGIFDELSNLGEDLNSPRLAVPSADAAALEAVAQAQPDS